MPRARLIILSSALWGFAAHGYMFFNKFSFHDDVRLPFHIGATVTSGRWFLEVLKWFSEKCLGGLFSLPLFNGLLSLFFVALSACLIADLLNIHRKSSCICLAGVMVTFPAFTSTLGYMYTSPFYMIGLLFAVAGSYMICKHEHRFSLLIGCILSACAIGIYQAGLPMILSLMLMYTIYRLDVQGAEFRYWYEGFRLVGALILTLIIYIVMNHVCLHFTDAVLSDYESINTYGFEGWGEYLHRLKAAYSEFFIAPHGKMRNMFPQPPIEILHIAIVSFGISLAAARAVHLGTRKFAGVKFILLILLFPLAANFAYIMVDTHLTHSLMMYSRVSVFILFIMLLESSLNGMQIPRVVFKVGIAAVACIALFYCRFANICYFKAEFQQSQAISYFTRLVSHIESIDGYSPEFPVAFLNERKKQGFSAPAIPEFDEIRLLPYYFTDSNLMINNYAWKDFMRMWCGYAPIVIENTERIQKTPEALSMPRYPADGSIRVIDGTVVVKF